MLHTKKHGMTKLAGDKAYASKFGNEGGKVGKMTIIGKVSKIGKASKIGKVGNIGNVSKRSYVAVTNTAI